MVKATLVGSYPKPKDIFAGDARDLIDLSGENFYEIKKRLGDEEFEKRIKRGIENVVQDLIETDIDVITDGEVERDHYIHYHLRHWNGVDYKNMAVKKLRKGGKWDERKVPRVFEALSCDSSYLVDDFIFAQQFAKKPLKVNLPGPSTLVNFTADEFYNDKAKYAQAASKVIRELVGKLYDAGCRFFQFDDPVLMRDPEAMDKWGIPTLEACFAGLGNITSIVHVCRGYPNKKLEAEGIKYKADERNYEFLLKSLQKSSINQISIEAEECKLDLSVLKDLGDKSILLGMINVGSEEVEPVEYMVKRGKEALKYILSDQLWLATDCGMLMLPREKAKQKLTNLALARDILNDGK